MQQKILLMRTIGSVTLCVFSLVIAAAMGNAGVELEVPHTITPPKIDGRLDDPCWQRPPLITEFRCVTKGNPPPTQQTVAWVAWDEDALYVAAKCFEERMDMLQAHGTGIDAPVWRDDCIELFLMPGMPYYYHFAANLLGTRYDARVDTRPEEARKAQPKTWDANWRAAGHREKDHWTMELAIPFASLDLGVTRLAAPLRFNLGREERRLTEFSCWPASGFHNYNEFAILKGIRLDSVRYGISLREVKMGEGGIGPNRFTATIAEEPAPGTQMKLRAQVKRWPDGESKIYETTVVSVPGKEIELGYEIPAAGGVTALTVELLDSAGKLRASLAKFLCVPAMFEGEIDRPILYLSDNAVLLRGRLTVSEALLKGCSLECVLTSDSRILRKEQLSFDTRSGEVVSCISLKGLNPGRYTLEIRAIVPSIAREPIISRFPFRLVVGPFD